MENRIGWGILGCGWIAERFAQSLAVVEGAELVAVAARDLEKAGGFARATGARRAYGSYADLLADEDVQVVYIATTHNFHLEHALQCLQAGRHVLCEKPLAVSEAQGRCLVDEARRRNLFLMEAVWTRFHPATRGWIQRVADGAIGELRIVKADFGIRVGLDPTNRWFNRRLAGGALLDLGIYPITFASLAFGSAEPESMAGFAHIGDTGVDEHSHYLLNYSGGRTASLSSSFTVSMPHDGWLYGTDGYIHVPDFFHPQRFTLHRGGKKETVELPYRSTGYADEAEEVMRCLRGGLVESPLMTWSESLRILRTMDRLRAQWGLRYDGE